MKDEGCEFNFSNALEVIMLYAEVGSFELIPSRIKDEPRLNFKTFFR